MKIVRVSDATINGAVDLIALNGLGGGAVASFTGIARKDSDVTSIELEHFPGMTERSLSELVEKAFARWSLLGAVLIHRVGRIEVGEPIVLVGTAASHRAEALDACAFLIDRLKTDAPFWKKEYRSDGTSGWVEAKASDEARMRHWAV